MFGARHVISGVTTPLPLSFIQHLTGSLASQCKCTTTTTTAHWHTGRRHSFPHLSHGAHTLTAHTRTRARMNVCRTHRARWFYGWGRAIAPGSGRQRPRGWWNCRRAGQSISKIQIAVNLKNLHHAPFFQNGAKSGFEMCFDIGSRHLGCWGQNTSRIQNKKIHATLCLQAQTYGVLKFSNSQILKF